MGTPNNDAVRKICEDKCRTLQGALAFAQWRAQCEHTTWDNKWVNTQQGQMQVWECQGCRITVNANDPICK